MAHRVTAVLVDDLDGYSTAVETVYFALDGVAYEIDLSAEHADELRECLRPWQERGRVVPRNRRQRRSRDIRAPSSPRSMTRVDRAHAQAIRTWAVANGLRISARGKIPDAVHRAFEEAHASA
ncbi:Lsr2 family protein [Microlunatus sp. Gsoil 973]|uniref:histone-like nucleoid-structuring protein Lsr2 n=1 Tax=Microlunatus sp. Gsoil 973 TaxID=2672569 RepID=UPI0012B4CE0C|nr:Lsr2 family protein [Microlunatus sp. Gsoil 973]QGN34829.1 Lsr2 family protein [Microlunatus sp. Gsoil 973]